MIMIMKMIIKRSQAMVKITVMQKTKIRRRRRRIKKKKKKATMMRIKKKRRKIWTMKMGKMMARNRKNFRQPITSKLPYH